MPEELDPCLRELLRDQVDTHEKLDILLAVRGRAAPVSLPELAQGVRLTAADVKRAVAALCASGLLIW